ncbi:hypothetical protein [Aureibacter tunicatorum]|uniref:Uncharacterized protein n=1 Tax=Aureibacter tunicatorum TaxID=866807 RepID=A0AAE4BSX8_9BACT|nr:hypothetical protein [Aureibacter tunicatorum]MDR6239278.1 hypothetical protein [Aureibacter tunicatorum]BDD04797.1 hypothetical protein AUTU_22800 [Aureibacter tunicatorum]
MKLFLSIIAVGLFGVLVNNKVGGEVLDDESREKDKVSFVEIAGPRSVDISTYFYDTKDRLDKVVVDVYFTKDNVAVIAPKPNIDNRIFTKADGDKISNRESKALLLYDIKYEELGKYDYQELKSAKIRSLQNFLKAMANEGNDLEIVLNIPSSRLGDRILHPQPKNSVAMILTQTEPFINQLNIMYLSSDKRVVKELNKKKVPKNLIGYREDVTNIISDPLEVSGMYGSHYLNTYLVEDSKVLQNMTEGINTLAWDINDRNDIRRVKKCGCSHYSKN